MRFWQTKRAIGLGLATLLTACAGGAYTGNFRVGQQYKITSGAMVVPCPAVWHDYQRVYNAPTNLDRVKIVLADGGTTLMRGDAFTIVGFGSETDDPPVHIRSHVNNALCWLPEEQISDMIKPE